MAALYDSYDELIQSVGLTDDVLIQPCIITQNEEIFISLSQNTKLSLDELLEIAVKDDTTKNISVILDLNGSKATNESLLKALVEHGDDSVSETVATGLKKACHPHGSFAPVQTKCTAKWFVNGEDYMAAVFDAFQNAKHEIMITDWMFSAQIFLKRTKDGVPHFEDDSRLDKILLKKADEEVKIILLIYHGEMRNPLKKNSYLIDLGHGYSKKLLEHRNIVFILDPVKEWGNIYWSHHEKLVVVDQTLAFVGGIDLCYGRWDNHQHRLIDSYPEPPGKVQHNAVDGDSKHQTWIGLDYMNDFVAAYTHDNFKEPSKDYIDRSKHPRLPWHDIACCVSGDIAKDVAQHFKQRYELSKSNKEETDEYKKYKSLEPLKSDMGIKSKLSIKEPSTSNCTCQVLRSVSNWSAGIETELSIQNAYIHAIEHAEHFVYIENQFFISSLKGSVKATNKIAETIKKRIARAYKEKKKFRVILVIPLKPEITGDFLGHDNPVINIYNKLRHGINNFLIQDIMNLQYLTLSRDKCSIIQRLKDEDGMSEEDISNYLSIYGLRTCDFRDSDHPVTEIVYVHAKCMIVDDRIAIIGSANINERSMTGDRDSEVVIRFEDNTFIDSCMNGLPYKAGEFAHSLRLQLFREHMGLEEGSNLIIDPLSDEFYKAWNSTATTNNDIFKEVFGGKIVPVNGIKNYAELYNYRKTKKGLIDESDICKAKKRLQDLKGNLIPFPMDFLINTNMSIIKEVRSSILFKLFYDPVVMMF